MGVDLGVTLKTVNTREVADSTIMNKWRTAVGELRAMQKPDFYSEGMSKLLP
jgi:hypothetical protein